MSEPKDEPKTTIRIGNKTMTRAIEKLTAAIPPVSPREIEIMGYAFVMVDGVLKKGRVEMHLGPEQPPRVQLHLNRAELATMLSSFALLMLETYDK